MVLCFSLAAGEDRGSHTNGSQPVLRMPSAGSGTVGYGGGSKLIRRSRELLADAEPQNCDGSRPCAVERFQVYPGEARGGEQASPVAEQDRQDEHHDLVDESTPQALTGYVGAKDFEVLAARGAERGGDGFPDITGEERDRRVRRVRWLMGKDELSSPS